MTEQTLSDFIVSETQIRSYEKDMPTGNYIEVDYVREAVKKLKDKFNEEEGHPHYRFLELIEEIFGEKLI